jgi:hypothetical protein
VDAQTIRDRIKALEALADPGRTSTPEHERAAAERMLHRHRTLLAEVTNAPGVHDNRWYGDKYANTRGLSLTEVAKLIRAEVKVARKVAKMTATPGAVKIADPIGDAPAEIKVSVRTAYYSCSGSIQVTLRNIPEGWGWTEEPDPWGGSPHRVASPALKAFARAVKDVMNSYNYDGSDVMTDYFDKRFYGGVSNEDGLILA